MSDNTLSHGQLSQANISRDSMIDAALAETQEASKAADVAMQGAKADASLEALMKETEDNTKESGLIKSKKLEKKEKETVKTKKAERVQESVLVRKDDAQNLAEGFAKRQGNREYRLDPSMLGQLAEDLGVGIHEESTPEEMVDFIRRGMTTVEGETPDVAMIDKAFEFLIETARNQAATAVEPAKTRFTNILKNLESCKLKHFGENADKIQVAEKIIGAVDAVVTTTNQTVKETLDRYRDIVHNPPDLQALRKFYEDKGFKAMMLELKGLNTYLGGNLKRTNMEGPELAQLRGTVVKMQGLLGVFRQAKKQLETAANFLKRNLLLEDDEGDSGSE